MFTIRVNGDDIPVADWSPQSTLLEFLRARGLTGSKEGCAEGECGACAVAMVVRDGSRSAYRVVNSCLMLLPMAADREIYTVEGLSANGVLQDAQMAMAAAGGSQCGYCTPGFVVSLFAEQHRADRTGPCDTHALAGNLCRCTGYRPIRDAAASLGPAPAGPFRDRLTDPAAPLSSIACAGYSRPASVEAALDAFRSQPGSVVVAGATDMGVEWNLRRTRWPHLVDLDAVDELHDSEETAEAVRIGAAVPLAELAARWSSAPAVLAEWLTLFASPLIRNRATLGGNLGTASPIGDSAPLLLVLDASVELAGPRGRRVVPLNTFFVGYRKTMRQPDEIIVSVRIPRPYPERLGFYKIAKRRFDDISTVAAAMAIDVGADGRVSRARFAFGGVAATPLLATEASDAVVGRPWNPDAVERVQGILAPRLAPLSDHRGSQDYRRDVSCSLIEKFWWEQRA
ncbi:MAG: FAD binding domain-containing protein [Acidobacteriota bacterium]